MDDAPGLFDLPEPERPAPPARTARGRARERFARRDVVDVVVVDAAALRAEALRTRDRTITISEGAAFDDEDDDLLAPEEEIATGVAAALQWCVEPTDGMWPLVETGAVRIDAVDLAAQERGPSQVRASWTVTIKITDAADVRERALAACPVTDQAARAEIDATLRHDLAVGGGPLRPDDRHPGRDLDVRRGRSRAGARPIPLRRAATERLRRTCGERPPRSPVRAGGREGLGVRRASAPRRASGSGPRW